MKSAFAFPVPAATLFDKGNEASRALSYRFFMGILLRLYRIGYFLAGKPKGKGQAIKMRKDEIVPMKFYRSGSSGHY
jgi:hypothetical protein